MSHTTSEISADCLYHRVAGLPVVAAGLQQMLSLYNYARETSPYFAQLSDGATKVAIDSSNAVGLPAFYEKYLEQHVDVATKLGCQGLDRVESAWPAIHSTPEEIQKYAMARYEVSRLKSILAGLNAINETGKEKVNSTIEAAVAAPTKAYDLLNDGLNFADEKIDLAFPGISDPKSSEHDYAAAPIGEKIGNIGWKLSRGVGQKVSENFGTIWASVEELRQSLKLIDYFEAWKRESISRGQVVVGKLPQSFPDLLLGAVRNSVHALSLTMGQAGPAVEPYLPPVLSSTLKTSVTYFSDLDSEVSKMNSLAELGQEVQAGMKSRMDDLQQLLAQLPITNWLPLTQNSGEAEKKEE